MRIKMRYPKPAFGRQLFVRDRAEGVSARGTSTPETGDLADPSMLSLIAAAGVISLLASALRRRRIR